MHTIISEITPRRNHSKIWPKGDKTKWIHIYRDKERNVRTKKGRDNIK